AASLGVRGVSVGLRDERLDREAAPDRRPGFTVRREDPIPLLEGHRAPHLARLFPRARHVEPDAPLALEGQHPRIERADEDEVSIPHQEEIRRELRLQLRIVGPVDVDDAEEVFLGRPLTPSDPGGLGSSSRRRTRRPDTTSGRGARRPLTAACNRSTVSRLWSSTSTPASTTVRTASRSPWKSGISASTSMSGRRALISRTVFAKCAAPPSARSSRSTDVKTT